VRAVADAASIRPDEMLLPLDRHNAELLAGR